MSIGSFTHPEQGFEAFVLNNGWVALTAVPELGAKVVSLKNVRTDREWLYHPPHGLRLFRNQPGDDFATSPMAGWDECLPTVAACAWNGRLLPDHGEAWSVDWTWDRAAWRQGVLSTTLQLPVSPFDFHRSIELAGPVVQVTYTLVNRSDRPEAYLWAMHPLLAIHQGDQLELPPEAAQLAAEPWVASLDFAGLQPACAKRFVTPLQDGRAGVYSPRTGDRLTFTWDTADLGVLGLWLTRGGWHGHHHLALEPTNGADDSLAVAAGRGQGGRLGPRETRTWTVQLTLEP